MMNYLRFKKIGVRGVSILAIIVIIVTSITIGFFKFEKSSNKTSDIAQGTVSYNAKFKDDSVGNIVFPAYTKEITLNKKQKIIPLVMANPEVNGKVYFEYKISFIDPKNSKRVTVGKSKLIPSGRAIDKLNLTDKSSQKIPKGNYKARIDVFAYILDKNKEKRRLNQAYWDVDLKVINDSNA